MMVSQRWLTLAAVLGVAFFSRHASAAGERDKADPAPGANAPRVTLRHAVESALKETKGGTVLRAGAEGAGSTPNFHVHVLTDKGLVNVIVDSASGAVLDVSPEKSDAKRVDEVEQAIKVAPKASLSPEDALTIAENQSKNGTAHGVIMKADRGAPIYEVNVTSSASVVRTRIDAATGKVLKKSIEHPSLSTPPTHERAQEDERPAPERIAPERIAPERLEHKRSHFPFL